jgi:hypothetical protein
MKEETDHMATLFTRPPFRGSAVLAGALAGSLWALPVRAQEPAPPDPPPSPPVAQEGPAPEPAPAPPPAPTATVAPAAPAAVVTETKPPAFQHKKMDPPAIWFRLNNVAQNPKDTKKLDGFSLGSEVDVLFSGQVHEYVGWQADFVATFGNQNANAMTGSADILDLIGKFDIADPVHLWVGRMLVPSDRSNFSGPWFMSPWNYPGSYLPGPPVGPRQGPFGRNDGATLWGQFFGGYAKYYLGAFDLHDVNANALISGRLNFTLLSPEPGYYHSSTYYGDKDIVALGLGGQYKKKGSVEQEVVPPGGTANPMFLGMTDDYTELNADFLAEKKFGAAGVGSFEAAAYQFNGKYEPIKSHFYALVSYLLPTQIGIGRFQPLVRYQQADPRTGGNWKMIDAAVSYVVDQYAMRIALNYENADLGGTKANAIQIGIQIQK